MSKLYYGFSFIILNLFQMISHTLTVQDSDDLVSLLVKLSLCAVSASNLFEVFLLAFSKQQVIEKRRRTLPTEKKKHGGKSKTTGNPGPGPEACAVRAAVIHHCPPVAFYVSTCIRH